MMQTEWLGANTPNVYKQEIVAARHALADAARDYNWQQVLTLLDNHPSWVNVPRLGSQSGFTPLHQAAHGNAPLEVVQRLLGFGAWRSLLTTNGQRAVDIAKELGHDNLVPLLEPVYQHEVPTATLQAIQTNFHAVIVGRVKDLLVESKFRLPELMVLLELSVPRMNCLIPGMYGGFSYWLAEIGVDAKLVTESACRVVGGSGQRHEITRRNSKLIDEGFV
ncbi:MAG: ankyrin repeat domain-containing protein [Cyanobacteria bacterium P01_F01_bin.86]